MSAATGRGHGRVRLLGLAAASSLLLGACKSPTESPDPNEPASIAVAPAASLLVSVGDTVLITATVRNAAGGTVSQAVSWSSNATGVAKVDASGRVVATGNGVATITATAADLSATGAVTVQQRVDSVVTAGDAQSVDVGSPLASTIVLTLLDARGHPVAGAPVSFTAGAGSVSPEQATTDADGSASTEWTLGTTSGLQDLEVVAGFDDEAGLVLTAYGYALDPETLTLFSGDDQTELPGLALPESLRVQALDMYGNGVPDVVVLFSVTGDASLGAGEAVTEVDGVASVALTLGSVLGGYTAAAEVPDSLTVTGLPLSGSPVTFTSEAVAYALDPVSALTVGDTTTLTGTGFHAVADSNSVLLGGVAATIVGGSQTELRIEVPGFGCTPLAVRSLGVTRTGAAASQPVAVTPAGALDLAVGEQVVVSDPDEFCVQLLPVSDDEYLVGLGAPEPRLTVRFDEPIEPGHARGEAGRRRRRGSRANGVRTRHRERGGDVEPAGRGEAAPAPRLQSAAPRRAPTERSGARRARFARAKRRLPDLRADPCTDYLPITAQVFSVGARLALATSVPLPGAGDADMVALLGAADALHAAFGDTGVDLVMDLLGEPAGWDGDARVMVVLTPEVSLMGVPAYASAVDHLSRDACPSSDEGRIVYVAIPGAATVSELGAALTGLGPDLTHHIAHIVQWARRLATGGNLLPAWLAEGQAELAVEAVGMALSGLGGQQDLGSSVLSLPGLADFVEERFDRLALFHGWDGAMGTVAGAPEGCSLFGFAGPATPCDPEAAAGAAWSFVRFASDRFGPGFPGGEPALHQAVIGLESSGDVVALLEALLGTTLPDLVVDWAGALYADGRLTPAEAPDLQLTSWKLLELLPDGPKRLTPASFGFADFQRIGSVVGGGTAYTLIGSSGAHGPLAVSVRDGAGGAISETMQPRLWVVRMR